MYFVVYLMPKTFYNNNGTIYPIAEGMIVFMPFSRVLVRK